MSAARPLFQVQPNTTRSVDENVKALSALAHVVEVSAPWALVHAAPIAVARIAQELSLEVFPAKRGGDYYAVRVGQARLAVAPAPSQEPSRRPVSRALGQPERLLIRGMRYQVKETSAKRRQDLRRWEVRKLDGDQIEAPYVVTFQSQDGCEAQCGCKDWIYRRRQCKHIQALQAKFGG